MEQELEQLEGTVEDIIYENTDNGYDAVGLIRRDAWDRGELGRVIGDDLQRLGAEFIKDLVRRPGTDIRQ